MENKKCSIGGQAVLEGVMMRAPGQLSVAVRKPSGLIVVKKQNISIDHNKIMKKPFLRGIIGLYDSLILGISSLNFSVSQAEIPGEKPLDKKDTIIAGIVGILFGVFLFLFLPLLITNFLKKVIPLINSSFLIFNLVDGIIRVIFFVLYLLIISISKDLQRYFQYHGAEHKCIFAFENGCDLTVENARKMSRFHPRCGTSFLLIVMLVSIFVFSIIPKDSYFIIKLISRIVFMPLIAGISYEILKLSGKYSNNLIVKILIAPGLWLQKITTKEPDDSQLEVAIVSIKTALASEKLDLDGVEYVG